MRLGRSAVFGDGERFLTGDAFRLLSALQQAARLGGFDAYPFLNPLRLFRVHSGKNLR